MSGLITSMERTCERCSLDINHMRANATYCSRACQKHGARDVKRKENKEMRMIAKNAAFRLLNRDRYLSFDGKYEGPTQ